MPRLRIAVADDERDAREYFEEQLSHLGHDVVASAIDGNDLLACCRKARPDLVIADVGMPRLDGIEAAKRIYHELSLPVILIAGGHEKDLLLRVEGSPVLACLVKPVRPADLATTVCIVFRRYKQIRALEAEACRLQQVLSRQIHIEHAKERLMSNARRSY